MSNPNLVNLSGGAQLEGLDLSSTLGPVLKASTDTHKNTLT